MKDRVKAIVDKYPNFSVWPTGGNCEAYGHPLDNGGHILITDSEDPSLPEPDAKFVGIGLYDEESEQLKYNENCAVKDLEKTIDRYIREGAKHRKEPKKATRVPIPVQVSPGLFVFDFRTLPEYMSKTLFIRQYMAMEDYSTFKPFHLSTDTATWNVWVVSTKHITESQAKKIGTVVLWIEEFFGTETYGEFQARLKRRGAAK